MKDFDPSHVFFVGQDVVCVDTGQPKDTTLPSELVLNQVYKIRWLGPYNHYLDGEYLGVRLFGLNRGKCQIWGYDDPPFKAIRFRPLVEDKLAVFKNMTAPVPHGEKPYVPAAPEGPVRKADDEPRRKLPVREKEEV